MRLVRRISATMRRRRAGRAASTTGSVGGGGFFVQYYAGHFHGPNLTLATLALLALALCAGVLIVEVLGRLVPRWRHALRARRNERRRRLAAADAEWRARALMSELCPHGWTAQITLFGTGEDASGEPAHREPPRVALDWAELENDCGRAAVTRRVWAPTIVEALEAMVADRRTDETLEQIEHGAVADGALWPDLYL